MSMNYYRIFIALKNDKSGYNLNNRVPSGRCVIETRGDSGKIVLSVQNLKPNILYKAFAIRCEKDISTGVPLGNVSVDSKGRGEFKLTFDAPDFLGSKIPPESINVVALIIPGSEALSSPLVGYAGEPVNWKRNFSDLSKQKPAPLPAEKVECSREPEETTVAAENLEIPEEISTAAENPEEQEETTVAAESLDMPEEISIESESPEKPEEISVKAENLTPEETEEALPMEAVKQQSNSEIEDFFSDEGKKLHEAFKAMAREFGKGTEELENFNVFEDADESLNRVYIEQSEEETCDELEFLFRNYIEMTPFKSQRREVKWIRVSLKELVLLPIDFWLYMNHPFVVSCHGKFRHLIMGMEKKDLTRQYYIGLPDIYDDAKKLKASQLGFIQFKCCEDENPKNGEYGYWLMPIE